VWVTGLLGQVDKEGANVNRVMSELTAYGVLLEALGGDVLSAEVINGDAIPAFLF
jgi:hypothetical protein